MLARGISSDLAASLTSLGHTISSLRSMTLEQLTDLGIRPEISEGLLSGRPPIPEHTLVQLLFNSKWVCAVCRSANAPIAVHHIEPWAKSRSHDPSNLIVLCLIHHAKAHSKGDLEQNLNPSRLRYFKAAWEEQVKSDDSKIIRAAAHTAVESWYFFNMLRLHDIATHERINLRSLSHYTDALQCNIIDKSGCLIPENSKSLYAYSGKYAQLRYWYARDLFFAVLEKLSIINISDRLDRDDLGITLVKNDIIYLEGAFSFKQENKITRGQDQIVTGTRSANSIRVQFVFDRWYATSTSASTVWLSGRSAVGSFCKVGEVSRENGKLVVACTVLAICAELPGLRHREYVSASAYAHWNSLKGSEFHLDE